MPDDDRIRARDIAAIVLGICIAFMAMNVYWAVFTAPEKSTNEPIYRSNLLKTCADVEKLKRSITPEAIFVGPIMLDIETAMNARVVRIHRTKSPGNYALLVDPHGTTDNTWVFETDSDHMDVMICLATHLNEMIDKVKSGVRNSVSDSPLPGQSDRTRKVSP